MEPQPRVAKMASVSSLRALHEVAKRVRDFGNPLIPTRRQ